MRPSRYGEDALYIDLEIDDAPDRAARTLAAAHALRASALAEEIVLGAGALLLCGSSAAESAVAAIVREALAGAVPAPRGRAHLVPVVYDGPDLAEVAAACRLTAGKVVALHAEPEYLCELVGFLPGFGYLRGLDPRLLLARRPAPRPRVEARSVAIAGPYTGIYPCASPGGWNLIGRAVDTEPFDPDREEPALFAPGDRVRFVPTEARGPRAHTEDAPPRDPPGAALEVIAATGCATIQDLGRARGLSRGIPLSGALDPELLVAANQAVGNVPGAAAIEIAQAAIGLRARRRLLVSIDGAPASTLGPGETLRVAPARRAVGYVAAGGGIDVPVVLGSRSTLLVARLGGHGGRALARGDRLALGADHAVSPAGVPAVPEPSSPAVLELVPHEGRLAPAALDALLAGPWSVSGTSDRVGVRLEGARVPRDRADLTAPVPMLRGAIQITTDGTPIVLGPDHPATGGYPVLGVLRRRAQALLARLRPGHPVVFRLA